MAGNGVYRSSHGPLQQGDILVAPVARVAAADFWVPDKWDRIDQSEHTVNYPDTASETDESVFVLSGRTLVMVTSHDCHHDKEWNTERERLIRSGHSASEAGEIAESDPTLDRTLQASPLVPLSDIEPSRRGNYEAGRVVGYFPLPEPSDGSFPPSVVDLTYRCTIDRLAITARRWCLAPQARDRLRYAIARFDSFRSVSLTESLEEAIGKSIADVSIDSTRPLAVDLTLDDGSVLHLVQPPIEPEPAGRSRM